MNEVDNLALYDENWDSWVDMKVYGPASRWLRLLVFEILREADAESIQRWLDLGCGEGTNTFCLARQFRRCEFVGIDFSRTGIAQASRNYRLDNLKYIHDLESEALTSKFDMISCFEVLEHVEDWQALLLRMIDSSSRYLLLSFPTGRMRAFEKNVGHLRNFKRGEVEAFLRENAFAPVQVRYAGFPFYSPLYREVCNLTDIENRGIAMGRYGWKQKTVAAILFFLFSRLSTHRAMGDQFVGLFEKR